MKLTNLSLAILVALGVTACGSSSNDGGGNQTPPPSNQPAPAPAPAPAPVNDVNSTTPDPTNDGVVKDFKLEDQSSVGSVTYVRGKDSLFNIKPENEGLDSATSVFLGIAADEQNPLLTNIVLGKLKDSEGKDIAQFTGSYHTTSFETPSSAAAGDAKTLQQVNAENVNRIYGHLANNNAAAADASNLMPMAGGLYLSDGDSTHGSVTDATLTAELTAAGYSSVGDALTQYLTLLNPVKEKKAKLDAAIKSGVAADITTAAQAYNLALQNLYAQSGPISRAVDPIANATVLKRASVDLKAKYVDDEGKEVSGTTGANAAGGSGASPVTTPVAAIPMIDMESWYAYANSLGYGVVDWKIANNHSKLVNTSAGTLAAPSTASGTVVTSDLGLVTSLGDEVKGAESQESITQTSRIFGHYYLGTDTDPTTADGTEVANSYAGAVIYQTASGQPRKLGAIAQRLDHVQYGRVTAKIDPEDGDNPRVNGKWTFKQVSPATKGGDGHVDFYFARGTGATTLAQMDALPKGEKIAYRGHAITWGVENSYAASSDIPTAFGNGSVAGIGNFVDAELDMGSKKFTGNIYNAFVKVTEDAAATGPYSLVHGGTNYKIANDATIEKRKLIDFSGDVIGNSVTGKAHLSNKPAEQGDLRASFFGDTAQEVAGSVNSTTYDKVFDNAKWGGVFGAKRTPKSEVYVKPTTSSSWLGDAGQ